MVFFYRPSPCHSVWGNASVRPHCYYRTILVHPGKDNDEQPSPESQTKPQQMKDGKGTPSGSLIYRGHNFQLVEKEASYEFQIDLPGVKSSDLSIEVLDDGFLHVQGARAKGGACHSEINQKYAFDESSIDATGIRANFVDGVLDITLPKKAKQTLSGPVDISVARGNNSGDESSNKTLLFAVDLPGVPINHVKVSYHEDKVFLHAERLRGGEVVSKIRRVIAIDTKKVDPSGLEGFLADGVLEIFAPEKEPVEPIKIPITTNPVAMEFLSKEEAAEKKEETINLELSSAAGPDEKESVQASLETVSQEEADKDEEDNTTDGWFKSF